MYNLRNRANKGVQISIASLLENQNKCWINVCSSATRLMSLDDSDDYVLDNRSVMRYLMKHYKSVIELMTSVSGDIQISCKRFNLACKLLGTYDNEDIKYLRDIILYLDMFNCYQCIYNAIGRKTGTAVFNPKFTLSPEITSKEYEGSLDTLARCVLGDFGEISFTDVLLDIVKTDAGIKSYDTILNSDVVDSSKIEKEYFSELLDLAEMSIASKYLNKSVIKLINGYTKDNLKKCENHSDGFFDTYRVNVVKRAIDSIYINNMFTKETYLKDLDDNADICLSDTCIYYSRGKSVGVLSNKTVMSPYCVDYEFGKIISPINNCIGYVGEYVEKAYLLKNNLSSMYNPVTMFKHSVVGGKSVVTKLQMYNVCWLKQGSIRIEREVCYMPCAFNFDAFLADYKVDREGLEDSIQELIRGSEGYKKRVSSAVSGMIEVLCDCKQVQSVMTYDEVVNLNKDTEEFLCDVSEIVNHLF